jgi:chromosome segregation ATPase
VEAAKAAQAEKAQAELAEARAEAAADKEAAAAAAGELAEARGELAAAKGKLAEAERSLAAAELSLAAAQGTAVQCGADLADLEAKSTSADGEARKLAGELAAATEKLTETEQGLAKAQVKSGQCVADLAELEAKSTAAATATEGEARGLAAELSDVRSKQASAEEGYAACEAGRREQAKDLGHATAKVEAAKETLGEEIRKLTEGKVAKEVEVKKCNERVSDCNAKAAEIKKELDSSRRAGTGAAKYCNFTLMQEDAGDAAERLRDRVQAGWDEGVKKAKVQADVAVVAAKAVAEDAREKSKVALKDAEK